MPEDTAVYAGHLDGIKSTLTVRENLEFWASVLELGRLMRRLQPLTWTILSTELGACYRRGKNGVWDWHV